MKKKILFSGFRLPLGLSIILVLLNGMIVYGQQQITANAISGYVNTISNKTNQAHHYAEQIANTSNLSDAKKLAQQALLVLQENNTNIKNAEKALATFSTPENKNKCEKYFNAIASDLADLHNKTEWAIYKANKIIAAHDLGNVKSAATAIMEEAKKIETIVTESNTHIAQADERLNAID